MANSSTLLGLGHYVPERRISNFQIESELNLPSGWVERRTGILARRYANNDQSLTDISLPAATMAINNAQLNPLEIDLLLLATSTPDHILPPSAPLLAHKLGMHRAGAIDLAGACSGFLYAFTFADALVRSQNLRVLIVAGNILSRRINVNERASRVLFADAAGAVILAPSNSQQLGLKASNLVANGDYYDLISIKSGGSRQPFATNTDIMDTKMAMPDGKRVYLAGINMMTTSSLKVMNDSRIRSSDITQFIPHQANLRMMEKVRKNLMINKPIMKVSLDEYGNSSAATIPLTLSIENENRIALKEQTILMTAVGAGFIGGAIIFKT